MKNHESPDLWINAFAKGQEQREGKEQWDERALDLQERMQSISGELRYHLDVPDNVQKCIDNSTIELLKIETFHIDSQERHKT